MKTTEVKVCGITNIDDARVALDEGADYLGLIFALVSPRCVTGTTARRLVDRLGEQRVVGVFVNSGREEIETLVSDLGLCAVQLHGDEQPADYEGLSVPVWRAVRCRAGFAFPSPETWKAERFVVDADVPGRYGGTGVRADWVTATELAGRYKIMLSGGLRPENVREAIRTVRPAGVDVSSGVESEPGLKDHEAVRRFVAAAKQAWRAANTEEAQ